MESPAVPSSSSAGAPVAVDHRTRMRILGAILLGLFLAALDQTIVQTALPRIVSDLRGVELLTWVVTVYLLTSTITGPFYGKLSDLYGRKPLLVIGITLFLLGSFLSGLSGEMWQLILFRGVQGLGAGSLFPIALAVIGDLFTPQERGKYQGLFGAVFGVSAILGPWLGGMLTDTLGWHWIFFVNLPIGLISLLVIFRLMPNVRRPDASRNLDYLGAAVFTVAISMLLVGLTNKQSADWGTPQVGGLIAAGLVLGAVFVWVESRAKEPILPLDLFRNRTYAASMVAVFLGAIGFFGAFIFLPQWFQFVQGTSATESGWATLPFLAGLIASSIVAGAVISRTGRYKWLMVGSFGLTALGLMLMTNLRADTPFPVLWTWMALTGAGVGPTLSGFTIIVQNAVPVDKLGVATSNLTFFRQIGGSVGLAIVGTVFGTTFAARLATELRPVGERIAAGAPPDVRPLIIDQLGRAPQGSLSDLTNVTVDLGAQILAGVPAPFRSFVEPFVPDMVRGIHQAYSLAVAETFWVGLAATVAATMIAVAIRDVPFRATVPARAGSPLPRQREVAPLPE